MLAEETVRYIINNLLRVVKRHLQRQNSRLIVVHYDCFLIIYFLTHCFFTLLKILGGGGGVGA